MIFCLLMAIPLLVELGFFLCSKKKFKLRSLLIEMAVQAVVTGIIVACLYYSDTGDTEIMNGRVTNKTSQHVSCSHSYRCHCHLVTRYRTVTTYSGSGKHRHSHSHRESYTVEVCDTCYEHPYDVDWNVYSSLGSSTEIERVDRQGIVEPPRWAAVKIGEPWSQTHHYTNYIKASPDTLFRHQGLTDKYKDVLPAYPLQIYDYYRLNRLVTVGVSVPDTALWNADISQINADLGSARQVNAIVVVTKDRDRDFFSALEQQWSGGKKNDAVLVLDVSSDGKVDWSEIMAWTQDMLLKVKGREEFVGLPLDRTVILPKFRELIATHFVRKPMADFSYLQASVTPSTTEFTVALLISLIVSVSMCIILYKNEEEIYE